jgi:hypothetical protein
MKLLSIDVGIKNLAFCLFNCEGAEKNIQILAWDVINLSTNEPLMCSHPGCIQPAKFADVCFIYVCAKHAKTNKKTDKNKKKVPKKEQTMVFCETIGGLFKDRSPKIFPGIVQKRIEIHIVGQIAHPFGRPLFGTHFATQVQ